MIFLKARGGLCNRVRTLDSMISLCKKHRTDLTVLWPKDTALNCEFEDLFEVPVSEGFNIQFVSVPFGYPENYFPTAENLVKNLLKGRFLNKRLRTIRRKIQNLPEFRILGEKYLDDKYIFILNEKDRPVTEVDDLFYSTIEKDLENIFNQNGNYGYINSCYRFVPIENAYRDFIPKGELLKRIENTTSKFGRTIGLHIRRSDHEMSKKMSPTDLFLNVIEKELKVNPETTFFLSTDDAPTKQEIIRKYGDNILFNEVSSYDRNSPEAVKDAVLDLYCLANTKKIYGSHHSSFSQVASKIGNIAEITVKAG